METAPKERLLIVDGHAYAYRAFHAIRSLSSPTGQPTNAIYGFIRMLGKMRLALQPSHAAVIWDGGLSAERMAALPEYKQSRPPMPEGLSAQIDEISLYLGAAGIASWCRDGVEADDWIGALAEHASTRGLHVVIASSDKDFMQLVRPGIGLLNPNDKAERIWTAEEVRAKAGVAPGQIVDWLSLLGDAVDDIAGVPGVGPKTAADLLNAFGSIDALYSRLPEVKSERIRQSLATHETIVRRNQELIRLQLGLPNLGRLEDTRLQPGNTAQLRSLFSRWGFRGLLAELGDEPVLEQKELL